MREAPEATPEGEWVRVIVGWSPYQFVEKRMPTPEELSAAASDTPTFVLHLYTSGLYNRKGLEVAGSTAWTVPPEGGTIEKDAAGRPTGRINVADPTACLLPSSRPGPRLVASM